ncbi:FAD-binding protein [Leucobacter tenebrionis]|uniref:FAD-binding protein n=1 Tax=Leucobacter tenebrionis TaxID=2873270 RepID=UPI001CA6B149|nr:FAD-binding protein [Leucobacter tenebrionis]QZY50911.1 FAD-binding protein [Leucobacter tenebrionis]
MTEAAEEFDLVVVGAGAGGLATANRAVDLGAKVLVLEKSQAVGGSALLSAGILWTAPNLEVLRRIQPDHDPVIGPLIVNNYDVVKQDVLNAGVEVSEEWHDHLEWGRACKIDIPGVFARWSEKVSSSGKLKLGVTDVELVKEGDAVVGVVYRHEGRKQRSLAKGVVLATGGFQGDAELRQLFIGNGADDIAVRSNPNSVGDGFRLGASVGAAASRHLSGFYGHTLPSPVEVTSEVFLRLTLYFSAYGVVVNREGRRFSDESLGDEVTNQRLVKQTGRRGVLIWDDRVQRERSLAAPYPSGLTLDRHAEAREIGARTAETETLEELIEVVRDWGVDGAALAKTLADYRAAAAGEKRALDAPLPERPSPLAEGPFRAVEIQPCMTIPYGGLRIDGDARVLDRDGRAIQGLFAVGADAGGAQDLRYIGGIIFGFVLGRRAAETALDGAGE